MPVGKKLYVGNLSYDIANSDLQRAFAAHGTVVSATVITERETGRSKGFGFVEMGSEQEAQAAISALNGTKLAGRNLTVNEARQQESRGGGHRGDGGGGGGGFGRGRGAYGNRGRGGGGGGYGGGGFGGGGGYGGGGGGGGRWRRRRTRRQLLIVQEPEGAGGAETSPRVSRLIMSEFAYTAPAPAPKEISR